MEFKEGIYDDMPFEEYNEIPAYRASDLKDVNKNQTMGNNHITKDALIIAQLIVTNLFSLFIVIYSVSVHHFNENIRCYKHHKYHYPSSTCCKTKLPI